MSKRKVYVCILNRPLYGVQHEARVYRDSEVDEYLVYFLANGVKNSEATYFTDDRGDAIATARRQLYDLGKGEIAVCTVFGSAQ